MTTEVLVTNSTHEFTVQMYNELRQHARRLLRFERSCTLQPTVLLHDMYLKLSSQRSSHWADHHHFLAVAIEVMRRIVIDYARRRRALKRGGECALVALADEHHSPDHPWETVMAVNEVLERLREWDEQLARLVELRFFCGFTTEEAAETLNMSYDQARRGWTLVRCWFKVAWLSSQ